MQKMALVYAALIFTVVMGFTGMLLAGDKEASVAKAVADYLISGRAVIAKNQTLINDASKGDKGFTPAAYEAQVAEELKKTNGTDLKALNAGDPVGKAVYDLHAAAMDVLADYQPVINEQGKAFKGFIPAVYGARTGDKFYKKSGIRLKQTSMKFRGDYNRPDEFEESVLKKFETGGEKGKSYTEEMSMGGRKVTRYMVPVYTAKSCLTCHGDPAGEIDIAGRQKEGYKEGDLRGAISVTVPVR